MRRCSHTEACFEMCLPACDSRHPLSKVLTRQLWHGHRAQPAGGIPAGGQRCGCPLIICRWGILHVSQEVCPVADGAGRGVGVDAPAPRRPQRCIQALPEGATLLHALTCKPVVSFDSVRHPAGRHAAAWAHMMCGPASFACVAVPACSCLNGFTHPADEECSHSFLLNMRPALHAATPAY